MACEHVLPLSCLNRFTLTYVDVGKLKDKCVDAKRHVHTGINMYTYAHVRMRMRMRVSAYVCV